MSTERTFTHPSVLAGIAAGEPWADPTMDPTTINWNARRATAAIPFPLVNGRPVNPYAPTGVRFGRNELGHWGEAQCADAIVMATTRHGWPWLLMVERDDDHGWALPGGHLDPGETALAGAVRELAEETGLTIDPGREPYEVLPARYVPDPRASDEAWMVTTPVRFDLGEYLGALPDVDGMDDARRAVWVPALDYDCVVDHLHDGYDGGVFPAHRPMLAALLNGGV
ncbi:NUDIX hydrolase [Salinispora vitiensis]|uniref:NUDIX hydrolase n=1 Tax=Salinispora vitiensis TaxID=999544 RepID=UPI00035E48A6|nr:NUDIX domain-containing protein [Salinispora vitiensis]